MIRSRVRWFEKGEKSNSYFLRLGNQNNNSSCIRKLKLYDDTVTTDSAEILDQLKLFYSDLYQDHGSSSDGDEADRFLYNPSMPKLDEDIKEKSEGRLAYNECYFMIDTFSFVIQQPLFNLQPC